MGRITSAGFAISVVAVVSRYDEALAWTRERTSSEWGDIALASNVFDFTETDYYEATMGSGLKKAFLAFEQFIDPATLPDLKRQSNAWEELYAHEFRHDVARPLNIDPGYITEGKLVLASTKDHSHRIYLRDGIYAEVTLHYQSKAWRSSLWTYPDYQRDDFQAFFTECREYVKMRRRSEPSSKS